MRAVGIVLALLVAGCVKPSEDLPTIPGPTPSPTSTIRGDGTILCPQSAERCPGPPSTSDAPLPVGRAWTYEGTEFYNPETKFTVVVARADENGYLLAGGAEAEVVYAALWGGRWYGEVDGNLRRFDDKQLELPLHDGKTWEMMEGYTLTARAADVSTPKGTLPGFIIEGKGEGEETFHGEYVPEIGNFVRLHETWRGGRVAQDVRMTSMTENAKWVWYEPTDVVRSGSPHDPAQLDLAPGFENVIVSAGGFSGGRVLVEGPGGAQWSTEFTGDEEWRHAMLPAAEGKWIATVAGHPYVEGAPDLPADSPLGWGHVSLAPVKWVRS